MSVRGEAEWSEQASPRPAKRSKRRQYTSKACAECRRRKLKCSGDEGQCERCAKYGYSCVYPEDSAYAEARRLHHTVPLPGHQQTLSPPIGERVPQVNLAALEAGVGRIEATLNALLMSRQGGSSRVSVEPEDRADTAVDFEGDTSLQGQISEFSAKLVPVKLQLGLPTDPQQLGTPGSNSHHSNLEEVRSSPAAPIQEPKSSIAVGGRKLPFPTPSEYTQYLDFFFKDINPCHSCVNENDFRSRSQSLVSDATLEHFDPYLLALTYIMFAFVDVLTDRVPPRDRIGKVAGWAWFVAAENLVGRRKVGGRGGPTLIQFLVFEALYLIHIDKPDAAYDVAGLACRLCFRLGLHQRSSLPRDCDQYTLHMRQRLLWTVYFVDRRTSINCGRPYGMHDIDIDMDEPTWLNDKEVYPNQPLPPPSPEHSAIPYLSCMVAFAKLAGEVWDQIFSATASKGNGKSEAAFILDARISHWYERVLPTIPLLPSNGVPTTLQHRQLTIVKTRMFHLRLLLRRRLMVSINYDANAGRISGDLAVGVVRQIATHKDEIHQSSSFRFHMAACLGGATLILATLLVRPLAVVGMQDKQPEYAESFDEAVAMLREIGSHFRSVQRIVGGLEDIIQVVASVRQNTQAAPMDAMANFPSNVDSLLRYGDVSFLPFNDMEDMTSPLSFDALNWLEWWDQEAQQSASGYGAPWF